MNGVTSGQMTVAALHEAPVVASNVDQDDIVAADSDMDEVHSRELRGGRQPAASW